MKNDETLAAEVHAVTGAVNAFAEHARHDAARPDGFWRAQRRAITERIEESERLGAQPVMRWAVACATLVLAGVLLPRPVTPPATPVAANDPDHELLLGVEQTMRRNVPRSLQAAEFLAAELNQAAQKQERQN